MSQEKKGKTTKKVNSAKLSHLEEQISELKEKLARSLADYSNLEKRIDSQKQLFVTLATTGILTKMVEVLDDFYLAQNHLGDPGLQMAIDKFLAVLKSEGLEEIDALGKEFDPKTMDCVDVTEGTQDYVVEIRKKGYLLNDHVLRPAHVVVGRETN
ncbi:MAG: nucleotide exchange factor GrpE [Patescibacteria group bacterium]|jgi:molecular chaperone GrpE